MEEDWVIIICQIFKIAVAALYNNAIVTIGGCTHGDKSNRKSSSVAVVELGQAELLH